MRGDHRRHDRETKSRPASCAASRTVPPPKSFKRVAGELGRYAGTVVDHLESDLSVRSGERAKHDRSVGIRQRVAHERSDDLTQSGFVSGHDNGLRHIHRDLAIGRDGASVRGRIAQDDAQVHPIRGERPTLVKASKKKQVIDQLSHPS